MRREGWKGGRDDVGGWGKAALLSLFLCFSLPPSLPSAGPYGAHRTSSGRTGGRVRSAILTEAPKRLQRVSPRVRRIPTEARTDGAHANNSGDNTADCCLPALSPRRAGALQHCSSAEPPPQPKPRVRAESVPLPTPQRTARGAGPGVAGAAVPLGSCETDSRRRRARANRGSGSGRGRGGGAGWEQKAWRMCGGMGGRNLLPVGER